MKLKSTEPTQSNSVSPRSKAASRFIGNVPDMLASLGFSALLVLAQSNAALAATAPSLGTALPFAVLGASAVTNTGPTVITGELGISPGTGSSVTGFPPGTSGATHFADAVALGAQTAVTTAYNNLAGQPTTTDLTGQDLGGLTLVAGVYNYATSAQLTGTLTLDAQGDANAVFIFKIGSTLTTASNSLVSVINGGNNCNVFWQVGSSATLGTGTTFVGNILALTSISLTTGANAIGRMLARNGAVTLDTNVISNAACNVTPPVLAATTISTQASSSVPLGGAVNDTAVLGGTGVPQGTITYRLYGPNDATCSGAAVFTTTASVDGTGSYPSPSFTPSSAGTYRWIASYGGDSTNAASTGACNDANESVVVTAVGGSGSVNGIPTLSEWAMILLAGLLAIGAFAAKRRKQI